MRQRGSRSQGFHSFGHRQSLQRLDCLECFLECKEHSAIQFRQKLGDFQVRLQAAKHLQGLGLALEAMFDCNVIDALRRDRVVANYKLLNLILELLCECNAYNIILVSRSLQLAAGVFGSPPKSLGHSLMTLEISEEIFKYLSGAHARLRIRKEQ